MRMIFAVCLVVIHLFAVSVEDARWIIDAASSIDEGLFKARSKGVPIVVVVIVKEGCSWCDLTVETTLSDEEVRETVEKSAVLVIDDFYAKRPYGFEATHTPTFFFVDARTGSILDRVEGYLEPFVFRTLLMRAVMLYDRKSS